MGTNARSHALVHDAMNKRRVSICANGCHCVYAIYDRIAGTCSVYQGGPAIGSGGFNAETRTDLVTSTDHDIFFYDTSSNGPLPSDYSENCN